MSNSSRPARHGAVLGIHGDIRKPVFQTFVLSRSRGSWSGPRRPHACRGGHKTSVHPGTQFGAIPYAD